MADEDFVQLGDEEILPEDEEEEIAPEEEEEVPENQPTPTRQINRPRKNQDQKNKPQVPTPKGLEESAQDAGKKIKQAEDTYNRTRAATQAGKTVADIATSATVKAGGAAVRAIPAVIGFFASPVGWIIVGILLIVIVFVMLFTPGKSYISSLAGGSIPIPADFNNPEHQAIVQRLEDKMTCREWTRPDGSTYYGMKLVIYEQGKNDIGWQVNASGNHYNKLDIRLLKTLDYLTDQHDRIMIGLLKTGAPKLIRSPNLINFNLSQATIDILRNTPLDQQNDQLSKILSLDDQAVQEVYQENETLSAYSTGQAAAILEVDRSQISSLYGKVNEWADDGNGSVDECGQPKNTLIPPIKLAWQDTVTRGTTSIFAPLNPYESLGHTYTKIDWARSAWEELRDALGFLDGNIRTYQNWASANYDSEDIARIYQAFKDSLRPHGMELSRLTFMKIRRIADILNTIINTAEGKNSLDQRTIEGLANAKAIFDVLNQDSGMDPAAMAYDVNWIGTEDDQTKQQAALAAFDQISPQEFEQKIRYLGSADSTEKLIAGIILTYKALQVANMVNWNDQKDLNKAKAYEARQKIRQVIYELKRMPNETYLNPPEIIDPQADAIHFDQNLVVKQIITYSPEDLLDNNIEYNNDVFPRGFAPGLPQVDIGGVGFDTALKDGVPGTIADLHFSHHLMDNGVFSLPDAVFVWADTSDDGVEGVDSEVILSIKRIADYSLGNLGSYFVSTTPDGKKKLSPFDPAQIIIGEVFTNVPVNFKNFLHVAF